MHSYAAVLTKLKPQEVLVMGPEGKRGVWRTIGSNAVFIEVEQGESVPQAIGRFEAVKGTKTESTLPETKPRWKMPSVISRDQPPAPPKLGLFPSGYSRQAEAVDAIKTQGIEDLGELHRQMQAGLVLDPTQVRYLQKNADLAQRVTDFVHRKLWPAWEKKAIGEDLTSLYAWQGIRAYSEQLRRRTEVFTAQQYPREVSALLDNRSGKLVGPVVTGSELGVSNDAQIVETSPSGDYTHIHSHTGSAGFGPDDLMFFLRMPNIRRMVIPQPNGDIHIMEKPTGFQFNPVGLGNLRGEYEAAQAQKAPSRTEIEALTGQMQHAKSTQDNVELQQAVKQLLDANYRSTSHAAYQLANRYGLTYRIFTPRQGTTGAYSAAEEQDVRSYVFEVPKGEELSQDREGRYGVWRFIRGHRVFIPVKTGARTGMPADQSSPPVSKSVEDLRSEFRQDPGAFERYRTQARALHSELQHTESTTKKWMEDLSAGNSRAEEGILLTKSKVSGKQMSLKSVLDPLRIEKNRLVRLGDPEDAEKVRELDDQIQEIKDDTLAEWTKHLQETKNKKDLYGSFLGNLGVAMGTRSLTTPEEVNDVVTGFQADALRHRLQKIMKNVAVPTDTGDPVVLARMARNIANSPSVLEGPKGLGIHPEMLDALALQVERGWISPNEFVGTIEREVDQVRKTRRLLSPEAIAQRQEQLRRREKSELPVGGAFATPDEMAQRTLDQARSKVKDIETARLLRSKRMLGKVQAFESALLIPARELPGFAEQYPEGLTPEQLTTIRSTKKLNEGQIPDLFRMVSGEGTSQDLTGTGKAAFVIPNFLGEQLTIDDPTAGKVGMDPMDKYRMRARAISDALKRRVKTVHDLAMEKMEAAHETQKNRLRLDFDVKVQQKHDEALRAITRMADARGVKYDRLAEVLNTDPTATQAERDYFNTHLKRLQSSSDYPEIERGREEYVQKGTREFADQKKKMQQFYAARMLEVDTAVKEVINWGKPSGEDIKAAEEKFRKASAETEVLSRKARGEFNRRIGEISAGTPSRIARGPGYVTGEATQSSGVQVSPWNRDALRLIAIRREQSKLRGERAPGTSPLPEETALQAAQRRIISGTPREISPEFRARRERSIQELQSQGIKNIGKAATDLTDALDTAVTLGAAVGKFAPLMAGAGSAWRKAFPRRPVVPEMDLVPLESQHPHLARTGMPEPGDEMGVPTGWLNPPPPEVGPPTPRGASVHAPRAYQPPRTPSGPKRRPGRPTKNTQLEALAASGRLSTLARLSFMAKASHDAAKASSDLLKEIAKVLGAKPKTIGDDPIVKMMRRRLKSMNPHSDDFRAATRSLNEYERRMDLPETPYGD